MIIAKQYELSDALLESNFQSFHARHLVTGRQVLVHLLTNLSSPTRSLADIIAGLNVERQAQLLDAGEHDGISYLVTVPIPGFTTLQAWLGQGETPRASSAPRPSDPSSTQMFHQPPGAGPSSPPAGDAGEFTQFFRPQPDTPQPRSFAAPPVSAPASPAAPGEFTRLFAPNASGSSPAPAAAAPGEFTRMFSPASSSQPAGQPSDATQLYGSHFPAPSRPEERPAPAPPSTFFHPSPTSPPASAKARSPIALKKGMAPLWVGVISAIVTFGVLAIVYLIFRR